MKKRILLTAAGLILTALAPATAAAGGNGDTGACLVILAQDEPKAPAGGELGYVCAADLTSPECDSFCGDKVSAEGGLFVIDCDWFDGGTCEDVENETGEPWDGACDLTQGFGFCVEIAETLPGWTSQEICEDGGGDWLGDGSTCGAPVPTLPKAGQAALMVVLLFGALVILNLSGFLRSA